MGGNEVKDIQKRYCRLAYYVANKAAGYRLCNEQLRTE